MDNRKGFASVGDILSKYTKEEDKQSLSLEYSRDKYVSREFQQYGYDLAVELDDLKHKALYIKLAKNEPRGLLEAARSYVKDAYDVNNRGKLFMWRLKKLKEEQILKKARNHNI